MRDKLMQFLTRNLVNIRYILLTDFSQKSTVATVSRICGFNGTGDNYSIQYFTIRKNTDNLPIAGKSMRGSHGLPFFVYKCFSRDLSEKEGKIIVVLIPKEGYKFIKSGPDFKCRKFTNCQL